MTEPRLLLIDDEPALAEFLASAAQACGIDPIIATNDQDFRDAFTRVRPQLVSLDLAMPGMDGVELIRFLADEKCTAPVLIVSGFDRRVMESAFRLGEALGLTMVGPLAKPVRLEVAEEMLTKLKATLTE